MEKVLVFDGGKTGCRAAVWVDGVRAGQAEAQGASGVGDPAGVPKALDAMARADAALRPRCDPADVTTVVAGLAGLWSAAEQTPRLRAELGRRYPRATVVVTSDAITSHAGALSGEAGVVLAAGTGVSVLAISPDGAFSLVDGWGYLLGDAGSGYAIGRAGLDQALREADGRGGSGPLLRRLEEQWGNPRDVPRHVHGAANPARVVAAFAREVFSAAAEGDPVSVRICDDAARELALSVAAAIRATALQHPVSIATNGGLLNAGPVLTDPLDRHLAAHLPAATRRPADGDALAGGYVLARQPELPHHSLLLGHTGQATVPPSQGAS